VKSKNVLTKTDAAAAIGIAAFLLLTTAFIGSSGRERAKRAVCLKNLKQLTLAWQLYAEDSHGKLVNGAPLGRAGYADPSTIPVQAGEIPWVGRCWADYYANGVELAEDLQESAIKAGLLWPYLGKLAFYSCPAGYAGEMLNYAIFDSMNGLRREGATSPGVWIKNMGEIAQPHARAVFTDEGWLTPDSFATYFHEMRWWDAPPVRHGDGATLSFADGHVEHWQWKGAETIQFGRTWDRHYGSVFLQPVSPEGVEDLKRLQIAVWGRLGY
jgi:prepilin-type processing-associated H-X9-DG protein